MNTLTDRKQDNKSQSAANAQAQRQAGGESIHQFVDNHPEAIVQRNLQGIANNSPQAKQHGVFQKVASNATQFVNVPVGFDGTPTQSMFAGPDDDLTTVGLGNCIAIVAYHTGAPSLGAVMRHYDTVNANTGVVPDAIGGGNASTFDAGAIAVASAAAAAQLVAQVPAAAGNTGYAVALGGIWSNIEPNTTRWQSRFNLIKAIVAAIGVEPTTAGYTANFDVATSILS